MLTRISRRPLPPDEVWDVAKMVFKDIAGWPHVSPLAAGAAPALMRACCLGTIDLRTSLVTAD